MNPHRNAPPRQNPLNPTGADETAPNAEAIRIANDTLSWLEPLCDNPHFRRFMEGVFHPAVLENARLALDVSKPARSRDKFAQRHHALAAIFNWPQQQRDAHLKTLETEHRRRDERKKTKEQAKPAL